MMANDPENVGKQCDYRMELFWQGVMEAAILSLASPVYMNIKLTGASSGPFY